MNDEQKARLAEVASRINAATPGPWSTRALHDSELPPEVIQVDGGQHFTIARIYSWDCVPANAVFVAAARTDIPWLLALVKELDEENAQLKADYEKDRQALITHHEEYRDPWVAECLKLRLEKENLSQAALRATAMMAERAEKAEAERDALRAIVGRAAQMRTLGELVDVKRNAELALARLKGGE